MCQSRYPNVEKGAVVDDRNFRGPFNDIMQVFDDINKFDLAAGHLMQEGKTVFAATHPRDRQKLRLHKINGKPIKVVSNTVLVGDLITTELRNRRIEPDLRVKEAILTADRVISLNLSREAATYAISSAAIPKMLYGTQWAMPSSSITRKLRTRVLKAVWGKQSQMRCAEIVLGLIHDATRIDPTFAAVYRHSPPHDVCSIKTHGGSKSSSAGLR